MIYFDVSPDGARLAFSTCAHNRNPVVKDVKPGSWPRGWKFDYDIVLANVDGSEMRRLTETAGGENFPVWSPDGSRVAYISSLRLIEFIYLWGIRGAILVGRLTVHNTATGETSDIHLPIGDRVAPFPPTWSPDGKKLAFVVYEGNLDLRNHPFREDPLLSPVVWTVGVDGSGLTRVTEAASGPAWSPDGHRIAVAVPDGENNADLFTFAVDGSDPVLLHNSLPTPWDYAVDPWMGNLSRSPDGSQMLFEQFAHIVNLDGSPAFNGVPLELTSGYTEITPMLVAWSPDGTWIAVRTEDPDPRKGEPAVLVYVVDRYGGNPRVLVETYLPNRPDAEYKIRLAQ